MPPDSPLAVDVAKIRAAAPSVYKRLSAAIEKTLIVTSPPLSQVLLAVTANLSFGRALPPLLETILEAKE
jgi:hypothetical protein